MITLNIMEKFNLSERDKLILNCVIQQFILNATPIGSRLLAKKYQLGLSPATIRNIMADLEELGLLDHPHTSAGRVPTDKGYRFYVDNLLQIQNISEHQKEQINKIIEKYSDDSEIFLKTTSQILSKFTNLVSYISYPQLNKAILEKIQLIKITTNRILVVVVVNKGPIKTISFELDCVIRSEKLYYIETILNEKLSGLSFNEIKDTIKDRISENLDPDDTVARIFINYPEKIFNENIKDDYIIYTDQEVLQQPEFEDNSTLKGIIELMQDKSIIVHLIDQMNLSDDKVVFKIGSENIFDNLHSYSLAIKKYKKNNAQGNIILIGPKRMNYSLVAAILQYTANIIENKLKI